MYVSYENTYLAGPWLLSVAEEQKPWMNWRKKKENMTVNIHENGIREKGKRVWEAEKRKDEEKSLV